MNKINFYCLSLFNSDYDSIIKKKYIPVGLGKETFDERWLTDQRGININKKNPYYGEYTFHYSLWKNNIIDDSNNNWVGFCTYRRFWSQYKKIIEPYSVDNLIRDEVPNEWLNFESVLVEPIFTNNTKLSKLLKHGKKNIIRNPLLLINRKKISIKVHFDMYHGFGNLDKAIDLLNDKDREKFRHYVETEISFNPYNMFVCKSKAILFEYYNTIFPWLENCENIFGLDLNDNYGTKRIYGFLAERFLSYWFKRYTKTICWPIYFNDNRS